MKICIIGFSGSGKSTLAKRLAKFYNINALHLDSVHFLPNWVEREDSDMQEIVRNFMRNNDSWVIDGNYSRIAKERFSEADLIIFLKYNRFFCLRNVISRYKKYKNTTRNDMANGCNEKIDKEFISWVLYKGRKKAKINFYTNLVNNAKSGYIFKNRKQLFKYLKSIGMEELK